MHEVKITLENPLDYPYQRGFVYIAQYYESFFKDFIYLLNHNINVWVPLTQPLLGPGPRPRHLFALDWESKWQPCRSQAGTQPTEPHQPGAQFYESINTV